MNSENLSGPKRILITGAGGFAGRWLASHLVGLGREVHLTDTAAARPGASEAGGPDLPFTPCDLTDPEEVGRMVALAAPDAIVHLAAQSSAAVSFEDPLTTFEVNVNGALNLLEAARRAAPEARILMTGSSEEYGRKPPEEMPVGEDSPIEPVSPYAASKAAQAIVALQYRRAYGSRVVLTRSFSHTGPGQNERFVLPSFARQCAAAAAAGAPAVIRTGNLDVVRDFLDVRDVVRAYALLLDRGVEGRVYNVCRGEGLRLSDALDALRSMTGLEVAVETDPGLLRPVDVPVLVGDNTRLRADTGWKPEVTAGGMLEDLYRWWLERS